MGKPTDADRRRRRRLRIRKRVRGSASKPRLCVYRSNCHTYAQLIDDDEGKTLVWASSLTPACEGKGTAKAGKVGERLAKAAAEKGIHRAVFDRNGFRFHGRVKAVAEGARAAGLRV